MEIPTLDGWVRLQVPPGSAAALDNPSSATPSFGADVGVIYTATLTVTVIGY